MEGHGGGESGPSDTASIRGSMSSVTWVCVGEITVKVHGLRVYGVSLGTGPRGGGGQSAGTGQAAGWEIVLQLN